MSVERVLPAFIRQSYIRKFGLAIIVVIGVVLAFSLYVGEQASAEVTDQRQSEITSLAEEEAFTLSRWTEKQRERVVLFSELDGVTNGSSEAIDREITQKYEQFPEGVYAIHYIDIESQRIRQSSRDATEGQSLQETSIEWQTEFEFNDSSEVAVSNVYGSVDGREELIAFASPIGDTGTAIAVEYNATSRAERFDANIQGETTLVTNSKGKIQFAKDSGKTLVRYKYGTNATEVKQGADGQKGVLERGNQVIAYAPVEGTDWVAIKRAPQSNAYALAGQVQQDVLLLVAIVLGGLIALGIIVWRGILRPIESITSDAQAIADGDLNTEIEQSDQIDEVGQLQDAFAATNEYLNTVAAQAEALADQNFDADVLDQTVPGGLGDTLEQMEDDLRTFITEVEDARDDARKSQETAEQLATTLEQQAEQFSERMARAADGDLTQRLDTDIDNDSMREIAEGFNEMLEQLADTVVQIRTFAAEVDASTDQITASAQEVQNASREVTENVQEIASGADNQNENLQQVSGEMSNLSATIEEVASSADEIADTSSNAAQIGERGRERASDAVDVMNTIEAKTDETVTEVEQLDEEMERIGEIIDLIEDIAEQTNILALNASIEAARAGEAGEGFAVVADEIKSLAQETSAATEDISTLVGDVQASTGEAVEDMREMGRQVEDGIGTVDEAITALEDIVEEVEEANTGIQSINNATDEQASSTEEVVSMIDEIESIGDETASQAENAAAATEEQTSSITEVSENIESLSDRASNLRDLLEEFETTQDQSTGTTVDEIVEPHAPADSHDERQSQPE